jgi:O-antigen/teichoic acid export membrane protein/GT2 family glycosyltransferase
MTANNEAGLRSNVGWMFVGQGSGYLLRVVYFVLIARALGVAQYGIVAAAFALVSLGAQYSRLGSGIVLLRYVSANRSKFSVYWGNALVTTLTISGVITIALRLIAPHILNAEAAGLVVFTSVASCIFEQLTISSTQVFQAFQRMRFTALLNLLTSLLRTLAAAALLLFVHKATALEWVVLSMIVSGVAAISGLVAVSVSFGRPEWDFQLFRSRAGEGVEYAFASSTNSVYDDVDKTMLSHYGMNVAVGIYAMAYRVIEMATMPITSIQLAAEPRLFALGAEKMQESGRLGKRLMSRSVLLSLATAVVLFVTAPILPLLVGRGFADGVFALRWLCLIPVFRSVHHITGSVLTCSGKQRARTINQMIAAALNFMVNLWLIPRYGWHGAAWASLFTDASLGAMNWTVLQVVLRRDLKDRSENGTPISSVEYVSGKVDGRKDSRPVELLTSEPLVSIIIPFYGQEAYLRSTVESARLQSYRNIEVIVVDDGSPVSALSVMGEDTDIRILRQENQGVAAARNLGFRVSSGEFVIFLDSDDLLEIDAVETHLKALLAKPSAALSFGAIRNIDKRGQAVRPAHVCRARRNYVRSFLASNPIGCPGAAMIRREAFANIGGYSEEFRLAEDYVLYLRLVTSASIVRLKHCVVAYRLHAESISRNRKAMLHSTMRALDLIEPSLSASERRWLVHARKRWTHAFSGKPGLVSAIKTFYYKFRAMSTVPISSYFGQEQ